MVCTSIFIFMKALIDCRLTHFGSQVLMTWVDVEKLFFLTMETILPSSTLVVFVNFRPFGVAELVSLFFFPL